MTRRLILSIAAVVGVALVTWAFPLFHVVPLDKALASREQANFDAAGFAEKFWDERLMPALPRAAEARAVLAAIDGDFQAAREKYGRTVGISNSYFVFIQGTGRVVDVDPKGVGLAVRDGSDGPDVVLPVRDGLRQHGAGCHGPAGHGRVPQFAALQRHRDRVESARGDARPAAAPGPGRGRAADPVRRLRRGLRRPAATEAAESGPGASGVSSSPVNAE